MVPLVGKTAVAALLVLAIQCIDACGGLGYNHPLATGQGMPEKSSGHAGGLVLVVEVGNNGLVAFASPDKSCIW